MLLGGAYFPPSRKVRSWSPREYALGHQQKPLLVESKNYLEKRVSIRHSKSLYILQIPQHTLIFRKVTSYEL